MKYIDLVIGSEAWKNYRRNGIGASEVSAVMGINPFLTTYQLWEQKVYGIEQSDNPAMKRGREREYEALEYAKKTLGIELKPRMIEHPEYPFLFSTLDGIDIFGEIAVEIKFANAKVHSAAKMGQVIEYYYPQIQSQLACTGLKSMYFLSCHGEGLDTDFVMIEVKRDDLFIEKMIEKEKEFYEKYLLPKEPPPLCDKDYAQIEDDKKSLFDELMNQYTKFSEQKKEAEENLEKIKSELILLSDGKNCKTDSFKATKFRVKGSVEYQKIPELQNVNLELYRKESREQWRFSKI